jgi:PAS domain S-box-containing protein
MTVIGTYDSYLVALSMAVACLASYTALDLGGRIRGSRQWAKAAWLATASIAMGGGIWSMHFIGMLAFFVPMPVRYDLGLTLLSLVAAIGVTGFAFFMIGTRQVTALEFVLSGIFMGIGIAAMHYTGMAAMHMSAGIRYDRVLVALSVLIAIGVSIPALWLAFRTALAWQRLLAAVVMGSAISGMHYTGMAAATFIAAPGTDEAHDASALAQTDLAVGIAIVTFVILLLALVASAFDRKLTRLAERETAFLRENEEQLRKLYRGTPLPLHAVGRDGKIEQVSDAWLKLLGYPREETTGRDLTDFMTEDSKRRYDKIIWPHLELGDEIQEVECRFVRKSGEILDVLLNAHQERAANRPVRMLGGIVDITARKRAESRLAEREAQLALFIEHAPAAIAMFDDKMRYIAVSSRFLSDYKLPAAAEIIGRSHYEIFPDTPRRWQELHARVLAGEELGHEEDPFPRQDGRVERVQWSMKPWRTAEGRIGGALLFSQFVTGILAESEARFRATFENAAVGIAHVAPDGRWLRVNEALCRILGYPADELITKSFQDITHPDDLAADLAQVERMREGKIDSYGMDKRYLRRDGSVVWARLTVGAVRKCEGSVGYLVNVIEDISARKQAERTLQTSKERLQFALDAAQLGWWQYDPLRWVISGDIRSKQIFEVTSDEIPVEDIVTKRIHPDDGERVWAAFQAALDPTDPKPYATEYRVQRRGEVRWVEAHGLAHFEGAGRERRAVSIVGTVADITLRKEREAKERLLMREISHRAKNMLSVVHSIAQQTASRKPEDFLESFSERIQALAASQDLLVRNEWNGVDVRDLAQAQLAHFTDLIGRRIILHGPTLRFKAASAQAIGLALRELSTNAAKYGALSTGGGHVDIGWGIDGNTFTISWTERGGPPVSAPSRRGFGTTVMESMVERSLDGKVRLDYLPSGVAWHLTCPATNALESQQASSSRENRTGVAGDKVETRTTA